MTDRPCHTTLPKLATLATTYSKFAQSSGQPQKAYLYRNKAQKNSDKAQSTSLKTSLWVRLSIGAVISISLAACQPPAEQATDNPAVTEAQEGEVLITADTVTLTKDHILNIKSKRYQPSIGLKGTMFAINAITVESPTTAIVQEILVSEGQAISAQAPLLTLQVVAAEVPTTTDSDAQSQSTAQNSPEATPLADNEVATNATKVVSVAKDVAEAPTDSSSTESTNNKGQTEAVTANKVTPPSTKTYSIGQLVAFKAPFAGAIDQLPVKVGQRVSPKQVLLEMSNPNDLQFIATLPIAAKPQLSVGQNVTFSVTNLKGNFTGQISHLVPANNPEHLSVHVHIIQHDELHNQLKPGMTVLGRVDYGQIEVGTIVPKSGIHNADLSSLLTPPYRALTPIKAEVWIIGQDQRLSRQQITVIEYDPETQQYLVAGINNDSLICLAPLPADSEGKKVVVS